MDKRKQRPKNTRPKEKKDDCQEDIISENIGVQQDFNFLMNAPVTEDVDFVFKFEKTCTVDYGQYADFFTLNLRVVSAALQSIPLHEKVGIKQKYFTKDQLTSIHNHAEKGKKSFAELLRTLDAEKKGASELQEAESLENLDDDNLDFLLSLDQPASAPVTAHNSIAACAGSPVAEADKFPNLDQWLDNFLEGTD